MAHLSTSITTILGMRKTRGEIEYRATGHARTKLGSDFQFDPDAVAVNVCIQAKYSSNLASDTHDMRTVSELGDIHRTLHESSQRR